MSRIKNYIDEELEQGNNVLDSIIPEDIDLDYYQQLDESELEMQIQ
jgi:hypothetical protein